MNSCGHFKIDFYEMFTKQKISQARICTAPFFVFIYVLYKRVQDLAELYYGGWLWGTYSSDFNVPIIQISRFLDMMDSKHNKTNVQAYFLHFLCFRGDLRNLKIVNFKRQLEKGLKNDLKMTCGPNKISHPLQKCLNYSL